MSVIDVSTISREESDAVLKANMKTLSETNSGADMREPTVNVMKIINEFGANAKTFKGKSAKDFLLKKDINAVKIRILMQLKRSNTIMKDDKNPVTANAIRKVIGPIGDYPMN